MPTRCRRRPCAIRWWPPWRRARRPRRARSGRSVAFSGEPTCRPRASDRRLSEQSRLELLRRLFSAAPPEARVEVGIGDDAAVLTAGALPIVWTVDSAVEGVHFRREW